VEQPDSRLPQHDQPADHADRYQQALSRPQQPRKEFDPLRAQILK
jgi:hypothetical protein